MAPTRISVAETPVVVLPLIGATVYFGNGTPPLAVVTGVVLPVEPDAAAVVVGPAVVGAVADFLLLLHAASTSTAAAATPTPFLTKATVAPPVASPDVRGETYATTGVIANRVFTRYRARTRSGTGST